MRTSNLLANNTQGSFHLRKLCTEEKNEPITDEDRHLINMRDSFQTPSWAKQETRINLPKREVL